MLREFASSHGTKSTISLEGTKEEIDQVRAMLLGVHWLRMGENQQLEQVARFLPLPSPIEDPAIPPKWFVRVPPVGQATEKDIDLAERRVKPPFKIAPEINPNEGWHSPSFFVHHLAAGGAKYDEECKKMFAAGFECLRSRRGPDGKFWEVWYLPFLAYAKGSLLAAIGDKYSEDWRVSSDKVITWLCIHISFGCANVSVQRAALTFD